LALLDGKYHILFSKSQAFLPTEIPALLYIISKKICRKIMKRDPIVEEIHQTRQKLLEDCGGDLNQLVERFKAAEIQDSSRLVNTIPLSKRPMTDVCKL
jgi:hypothetical protein